MYPPQPLETNVAAFVPEVLKPHFYRVLFLVGSEVEMPASNGQQRKQGSRRSPAKRVRFGEEAQGSGRGMPGGASRAEADFAPTKEQGVSRMLTINLNDVEKELKIR